MIDRFSRTFIVFAFHFLLLVTPFVWSSTNFELFEYPKMMLTYLVTLLIVFAWGLRMIIGKKLILKKSFWDVPILLFFTSQLISTITSIDMHTSIWGYYSRFHGGLASTITYITLYYAAVSNIKKREVIPLLITTSVAMVSTSLYSFGEHFGYSPSCFRIRGELGVSCWIQDVQSRVYGTFGQPNWQAAYIVTTLFLPLAFTFDRSLSKKAAVQKASKDRNSSGIKALLQKNTKLLALVAYSLGFCVLIFTKSRSGLAGMALGYGIFWLLQGLLAVGLRAKLPDLLKQTTRSFLLVTIVSLIIGASFGKGVWQPLDKIFFNRFDQNAAPTPDQLPLTPTTVAAPAGGTESGEIRKIVWQGALDLWRTYPWFGSGVETFAYSYYQVRPVAHNMVSEWDFLYNKAHNEFLNFLATTGLVGLIAYLVLLAGIVWGAAVLALNRVQSIKASKSPTSNDQSLATEHLTQIRISNALVSGLTALSVSNFFGFSTVNVATLLFLFPAFVALLMQTETIEKTEQKREQFNFSQGLGILMLSLALLFASYTLGKMYRADQLFSSGSALLDTDKLSPGLQDLAKASIAVPNEPKYAEELSLATAQVAASLHSMNQATAAAKLAVQAEAISDQTLELNPYHLNHYKTRARVFVLLAEIEQAFIEKAVATLEAATTLAPTDAKIWYNLGLLYDQTEQIDKARTSYEHTIALKSNYEQALISLAQLLEKQQDASAAAKIYETILSTINAQNPEAIDRLGKLQQK